MTSAMIWTASAQAAECPRKDALGTSRVLRVDPATSPRVGLKSFPQTLALEDHEVVLTFDDGPWPGTTPKVLAALAHECVLATFFLIGRPASEHPELVRRIAAQGHTIAHHTWSHPNIKYLKPDAAAAEIDKGVAAVEKALHGTATTNPSAPFFRYPYFEMTPATLDLLQKCGIAVFGADLWASDWQPMKPAQQLKLLTERLQIARKGDHPVARSQGANRGHDAGFPALSARQPLSRGASCSSHRSDPGRNYAKLKIGVEFL